MPLKDIETIVFVMLENRSFDHLLGYLSLTPPPLGLAVEGLRDDPAWLASAANAYASDLYKPARLSTEEQRIADPPHDHAAIAIQINTDRPAAPSRGMGGFVESYMTSRPPPPLPSAVMGYYDAQAVPVFDFLARHYTVCDRWFAALPCGTQPNRLMAMSGHSGLVDNADILMADQPLVYDWLTQNRITWCSYQWGNFLPFFALMPHWLPEITTSLALSALGGRGRFRRYDRLREDWLGAGPMPNVIFIEPEYTDGPHLQPNDDHPPTGVAKGQAFVADIYNTLTASPARWLKTMMIITYDEHGGFFDHVPPLPIRATIAGTEIPTTGVRVPALIVSPHVRAGVPFTANLDHTSFLQLLADKFTPGTEYSPEVAARQANLARLAEALTRRPTPNEPIPALDPTVTAGLGASAIDPSPNAGLSAGALATGSAFRQAAAKMATDHPDIVNGPGWEKLAAALATN